MTLTQYAKFRVADTVRSWLGTWPMSEFPKVFGNGRTTLTGVSVTEDSALTFSPFWSGVCIISADVASLPLHLHKFDSNGQKRPYREHNTYELLHDNPNPEMTSMVCRETMQAHALTYGNAYAEIERDRLERPVAIWPITPDRVTPVRDVARQIQYRVTQPSGGQVMIPAHNMLHVPGLSFDGFYGYEVVQKARESIAMGLATEKFGAAFFGNGATFGGVLSHPGKLTTEVKQGIRESIEAVHGGVERAHKFIIVADGMKYERGGVPPDNAQFNETRKLQVEEAARWLRMPQHKLNGLDHATFSNIEHLDLEYYKSCLRGWLVRWEQEYNRKLVPRLERHRMFVKHNVEGFLRGDSAARSEYYTKMFNIGAYTINDILEREDMNRIGPEGDVHFVQGNLLPADLAMEGPPKALPPPAVKVKELPAADEDEEDDDEDEDTRALAMLADIATKTAAIEAGFQAQRDALSQAELEQHQQDIARLTEERTALQLDFDAYRERHAADVAALQATVDTAQTAVTAERAIRDTAEAALIAAREAAERHVSTETQARTDAEAARQAATAALSASEARFEAERADTVRLTAEATAAQEARDAAQAAIAGAREAAVAAETARQTAVAELVTQRQAETNRLTGMLAAQRALMVQVVGRLVRRETDRARRHQATPEKLRQWMEAFYVTHQDECVDELRPAIRAHLAWKQQSTEDVEAVTLALVQAHIAESERQLRAIVDGEPDEMHAHLERMLTRWEQDRPQALADQLLREGVAYVRDYR